MPYDDTHDGGNGTPGSDTITLDGDTLTLHGPGVQRYSDMHYRPLFIVWGKEGTLTPRVSVTDCGFVSRNLLSYILALAIASYEGGELKE